MKVFFTLSNCPHMSKTPAHTPFLDPCWLGGPSKWRSPYPRRTSVRARKPPSSSSSTCFIVIILDYLGTKGKRTMANWNQSQSSVVVVTSGTLLLWGSSLPMSLYRASLKGSAVEECSMCALYTAWRWSRWALGSLYIKKSGSEEMGLGKN